MNTAKKIIIAIIGILAFSTNAKALSTPYWADEYGNDIEVPTSATYYGWSSETSYSTLTTTSQQMSTGRYVYVSQAVSNDSLGMSILLYTNTRIQIGYLYHVNVYLCGDYGTAPTSYDFYYGGSTANALTSTPVYDGKGNISISTQPYYTEPAQQFAWCRNYTDVVTPATSGRMMSLRIRNNPTNTRSQYYLIGYSIKPLGIYNASLEDSIDNAIQNSGLATATSINEVKTAVNNMKEEIKENQEEQTDEIMNGIEYEPESVDGDEIGNLEDIENNLRSNIDTQLLDNIDIDLDINTHEFIWEMVEDIINTNAAIMGLIYTILALGIIKLVLNR